MICSRWPLCKYVLFRGTPINHLHNWIWRCTIIYAYVLNLTLLPMWFRVCLTVSVQNIIILYFTYTLRHNTGWREIDIRGCYSLMKAKFPPICACTNNRPIWHHNISILRSRDVISPLWWRHNAKSEKTLPGDNDHINGPWLFSIAICAQGIK